MQRIILDTNVIVSSLIQKNYPYLIVDYCIEGNVIICLSNAILQEYVEVLGRPKFAIFTDFKANVDFLIARLSEMSEIHEPTTKLKFISVSQKAPFPCRGRWHPDFSVGMTEGVER